MSDGLHSLGKGFHGKRVTNKYMDAKMAAAEAVQELNKHEGAGVWRLELREWLMSPEQQRALDRLTAELEADPGTGTSGVDT